MAFALRNLSVLAYANGFTLWHYQAAQDTLPTVGSADFFQDAGDMLTPGDMLMVSAPDGARILCVRSGASGIVTAPVG